MVLADEARDGGIPAEVYPAIALKLLRESGGELVAIPQFVGRTKDGAGQAIAFIGKGRFNLDDFVRVDGHERHAVVGQHPHGSDTAVKVFSVAIEVKCAANLPI